MKYRGPGRPPKPPAKKQSALVSVRFTPAERKAVERAARKSGLSISKLIRSCMTEVLK
jgi:predicted HicB family RNase H-like nuclease